MEGKRDHSKLWETEWNLSSRSTFRWRCLRSTFGQEWQIMSVIVGNRKISIPVYSSRCSRMWKHLEHRLPAQHELHELKQWCKMIRKLSPSSLRLNFIYYRITYHKKGHLLLNCQKVPYRVCVTFPKLRCSFPHKTMLFNAQPFSSFLPSFPYTSPLIKTHFEQIHKQNKNSANMTLIEAPLSDTTNLKCTDKHSWKSPANDLPLRRGMIYIM